MRCSDGERLVRFMVLVLVVVGALCALAVAVSARGHESPAPAEWTPCSGFPIDLTCYLHRTR